jgi:hypothetical protein
VYKLKEELEELVDLYRSMEEGKLVWIMLQKIDRYCSNWMHAHDWNKLKKELFLQIIDIMHHTYVEEEDEKTSCSLFEVQD